MSVATEQSQAHAIISGVYDAWNARDVAAFVGGYSDSATATLTGVHLDGKAAIRTTMTAAFEGPLNGSHVCHEVASTRRIGDAMIVAGRSAFVLPGEAEPTPDHVALTTWVLALEDGVWRIQAYHECAASGR